MSELSTNQKNLIQVLKYLKLEEDAIIGIVLSLKSDNQIADMAEYLSANPRATQSQILAKSVELSK